MSAVRALVRAELRSNLRDPVMGWNVLAVVVMAALGPPGVRWAAAREAEDRAKPEIAEPEAPEVDGEPTAPIVGGPRCAEARLPALEVVGAWPAELEWQGPASSARPIRVVVSEIGGAPRMTVDGEHPDADRVEDCLSASTRLAHERRLAALGISANARVDLRLAGPVATSTPLDPSRVAWPGLLAMVTLGMSAAGSAGDLVPRARSTGLLEQLKATATRGRELVWAWFLAIGASSVVMAALVVVAAVVSERVVAGAWPDGWVGLLHALPFGALLAASALRMSLTASDVVASNMRASAPMLAAMAGLGLSAALIERPWVAALVPFGGSLLGGAGMLGAEAWLADVVSLVSAAGLLAWCARDIDAEEAGGAGVDPTLLRRARGDFLPEALALGALGLSAGVANSVGMANHLWASWCFGFGGLMLLPAVLAGPVLGLPRAELLPLPRPRWPELALAAPVAAGLFPVSVWVSALSARVLPVNAFAEQFVAAMDDVITSPARALALGVFPAVCEEALFRGAVLGLLLRGRRPWVANLLQAAMFAVAHGAAFRLAWTFVFGLAMGAARLRTGSLWPSVAVHLLFNASAGFAALYVGSAAEAWAAEPVAWVAVIGLLAAPVWARRR